MISYGKPANPLKRTPLPTASNPNPVKVQRETPEDVRKRCGDKTQA